MSLKMAAEGRFKALIDGSAAVGGGAAHELVESAAASARWCSSRRGFELSD